jgi:hypothetical protein
MNLDRRPRNQGAGRVAHRAADDRGIKLSHGTPREQESYREGQYHH